MTQVLGVSPAKTGRATLLGLCGYRLESTRIRGGAGRGAYSYRVVAEALPVGVTFEQLEGAWSEQLTGAWTKKSPHIKRIFWSIESLPRPFPAGRRCLGSESRGCLMNSSSR